MIKDLCPGCGKHCYLDQTRCERGIEYAETGIMPPRRPKPRGVHDAKHSEQKMKYLAMNMDEKIKANILDMSVELSKEEVPDGLFECLREDDHAALLMLLEKVKHDWRIRAKKRMEE